LVLLIVTSAISDWTFSVAAPAVCIGAIAVEWWLQSRARRIRGAVRNAISGEAPPKSARWMIALCFFTLLLGLGLWQAVGAPLLPRLIAVAVGMGLIATCLAGLLSGRPRSEEHTSE